MKIRVDWSKFAGAKLEALSWEKEIRKLSEFIFLCPQNMFWGQHVEFSIHSTPDILTLAGVWKNDGYDGGCLLEAKID